MDSQRPESHCIQSNVTIVILTKNEEKRIADTICNALSCTPNVLLIDGGSTDRTISIAETLGAQVMHRAWDNDFSAQRNFALAFVKTDWVLYLDADEHMDPVLIKAVRQVVETDNQDQVYKLKRRAVIFGHRQDHGSMSPDFVVRLFPVKKVHWVNPVHEHPEYGHNQVQALPGYVNHYTYDSWEQYWSKFNQYTSIWAREAYARGKKVSLGKAFLHASFGFIKVTFLKGGFLDGWLGLAMCCNHFTYTMIKYFKLAAYYEAGKTGYQGRKTGCLDGEDKG